MHEPLSDEDLAELRARVEGAEWSSSWEPVRLDLETLLAEVDRLRVKVAAVELLADRMSTSCHYMIAVDAPDLIRAALATGDPDA